MTSDQSPRRGFKLITLILVAALFVLAGLVLVRGRSSNHQTTKLFTALLPSSEPKVVKVVDGDTADIMVSGRTARYRFIGMDTPEVVDPRKVVQCFGKEASTKAHELLGTKMVRLEDDPSQGEVDKYGRRLVYVFLPDGTLYNEWMIREGYAHEYTYQSNPYKYQALFKAAQAEAQATNKGLWSPTTCNGDTKQAAH